MAIFPALQKLTHICIYIHDKKLNLQDNFPFGTFPKINLICYSHPSLIPNNWFHNFQNIMYIILEHKTDKMKARH